MIWRIASLNRTKLPNLMLLETVEGMSSREWMVETWGTLLIGQARMPSEFWFWNLDCVVAWYRW
jgi:hypothetical protein